MPQRKMVAKRMVDILSVIAHPDRFRLIEELGRGEKDVESITKILDLPQSTVSIHLASLRNKKIVKDRRDGRHVYYSLSQPWVATWLLKGLEFIEKDEDSSEELLQAAKIAREHWTANNSKRI